MASKDGDEITAPADCEVRDATTTPILRTKLFRQSTCRKGVERARGKAMLEGASVNPRERKGGGSENFDVAQAKAIAKGRAYEGRSQLSSFEYVLIDRGSTSTAALQSGNKPLGPV